MKRFFVGCVSLLAVTHIAAGIDNTPPNLIAGKKVEQGAKFKRGDKLVGVWEKKNYLIEVVEVKRHNKLKVLWGGEPYDDIDPTDLYYIGDATPTRKKQSSPLPEAYRVFDKNGDGQIGLYEWDRARYAEFKGLDKNHDGFLTPQELAERKSTVAVATSVAPATPTATTPDPQAETRENSDSTQTAQPVQTTENAENTSVEQQ